MLQEICHHVRSVQMIQDELEMNGSADLELAFCHSQEVKSISDEFIHIATSKECRVEGLKHKTLPLWTFQAHPEASRKFIEDDCKITDEKELQSCLDSGNRLLTGFVNELFRK